METLCRRCSGRSLLEMLAVLAIASVLAGSAPPALQAMVASLRSFALEKSLIAFIQAARAESLHLGQVVTLCPLRNHRCGSDWSPPFAYFIDTNSNARRDANEPFLREWHENLGAGYISWNRREPVRFYPNASTTAITGSLRYCSTLDAEMYSFRLVIARTGRLRSDRNTHGCE